MNSITYHVIHCREHDERIVNIHNMESTLRAKINMFQGFNTSKNSLFREDQRLFLKKHDPNIEFAGDYHFTMPGQIGCYLSHHMLIKQIMDSYTKNTNIGEYSVIFEDDAIFQPNIRVEINNIVQILQEKSPDFDVVFLGNLTQDCAGKQLCNNIYYLDPTKNCWGTHALLLNNRKLEKIYTIFCKIIWPVDGQYKENILSNKLIGFVVHPILAFQNLSFKSKIWNS